jgi:hypothetical protein
MTSSHVENIADAILYEGYNLYPYRPSAIKNRQRWTFGVLYPRAYSERQTGADDWQLQTECLVVGRADAVIEARVRFLQLVDRTVNEVTEQSDDLTTADIAIDNANLCLRPVPSLEVGDTLYHAWQECVQRETVVRAMVRDVAKVSRTTTIDFAGHSRHELVTDSSGKAAGVLAWRQSSITLRAVLSSRQLSDEVFVVTLRVENHTQFDGPYDDRDSALLRSLVSTHVILKVDNGEFVSLLDPPDELRETADNCQNVGTWPVLVGEPGRRNTMLSAPIILYDYPRVAPESPGDLFDGTEVDEILSLRIQTLTDEEKREVAAVDPRTRQLLDRTQSLGHNDMSRLHGGFRDAQDLGGDPDQAPSIARVGGVELRPGSPVRLQPRGRADAFDFLLRGKMATVESIEQDYEGTVFVTVTVDDDPGRDFGRQGQIGHRFFFRLDEIEPVGAEELPS